jgi:hypothetical protein
VGYLELKSGTLGTLGREAQPAASCRPSTHVDAVSEGKGWDEYIDRASGKLRLLKQESPVRSARVPLRSIAMYGRLIAKLNIDIAIEPARLASIVENQETVWCSFHGGYQSRHHQSSHFIRI